MCASVGVKAKGESDQMMRNEGGGVFPESLMSPKWVFDTVKHRCLTVSNTHFGDMRDSGNTPPPSLRIIWSLSPLALTPTEAHMLRFLACTSDHYGIHTHAICTVPKLKLPLIRSLLYRRIFEFCFLLLSQNYCLYYIVTLIPASACENCKNRELETRAASGRHLGLTPYYFLLKRKR